MMKSDSFKCAGTGSTDRVAGIAPARDADARAFRTQFGNYLRYVFAGTNVRLGLRRYISLFCQHLVAERHGGVCVGLFDRNS